MSKAPSPRWPILLAMIVSALGACKKAPPPPPDRAIPASLGGGAGSGAIGIDGGGAVDASRAPDPAPPASATTAPLARPAPLSAADEEAIARAMCGPGPMRRVAKSWTCHCPSYTDFGGTDAPGSDLTIIAFHPGAFSATDREEAVLGIAGCESGATSSLSYGAHALVRRAKSGWFRLVYQSGALGDCTGIVSGAGLSRLICRQESGHMGLYRHQISLLGYVQKPGGTEERTQEILAFATNSPDPAVFGPDFKGELRILTEKRFEILGTAAYSAGDDHALSIEVEVEGRVKCVGPLSGCPHAALATALLPLTFTFDGRAFAVAPGSRRQLDQVRAREAE